MLLFPFWKFSTVSEIWDQWVGNVIILIMWSTARVWKRAFYMSCKNFLRGLLATIQQIFFSLVSPAKAEQICMQCVCAASGFILCSRTSWNICLVSACDGWLLAVNDQTFSLCSFWEQLFRSVSQQEQTIHQWCWKNFSHFCWYK